jgi:cytochrome c peroxidase
MKNSIFSQSRLVFILAFLNTQFVLAAQETVTAIGYGSLPYPVPQIGSYQLPPLGLAGDGLVLDTVNKPKKLHELMGDKIVLLSFIYATCSDVNGCPLATSVLYKIKNRLSKEPELAKQLRLLTLSFNPQHDTPEKMAHYGAGLQNSGLEWLFLTTRSEQDLQPILQNYQQNVQKIFDKQGKFTGTFSHNLRVYLIDKNRQLRNIYSVDFLHPDTLINDIKTLLNPQSPLLSQAKTGNNNNLYRAGDNKSAYETGHYKTQSIAVTQRLGHSTDLMKTVKQPPLGLPALPYPQNNPITPAKIALGKKLFYDRRLSLNNTFSCAMCHIPEQGFTNNEMATAVGVEGRTVRRNSPTLYNVAYMEKLFHDGRENTLEQQAWSPLLARNEMANPSIGYVIDKIKQSGDYNSLFEQAFRRGVSMETVGMALASYQRTLNSANSAFDRWFYRKQQNTLTAEAKRGYQLFVGKANCAACHQIGAKTALFTDQKLHNTGIGYDEAMNKSPNKLKVQVAPGVFMDVDSATVNSVTEPKAADLGLYEISQNPTDRWKYKTPSLRNISLTAPYMHNGRFTTLEQVLDFYNQGGVQNENLDPLIKPLKLSKVEINDLIAFLQSLTGSNVEELVADGFAATIGESK